MGHKEVPVTQLRKMMLEELQRRNYSQTTVNSYLKIVESFAKHFGRSPDQLGPEQIRTYQVYLLNERKLGVRTVGHCTAALRFFFCKTLKRAYPIEEVPYPKAPRRLPIILTREEVVRLIDSASNLFHRAMLITLYSTGMRRAITIGWRECRAQSYASSCAIWKSGPKRGARTPPAMANFWKAAACACPKSCLTPATSTRSTPSARRTATRCAPNCSSAKSTRAFTTPYPCICNPPTPIWAMPAALSRLPSKPPPKS